MKKIIKKIILILLASVIIVSCVNNKKTTEDDYFVEIDTTYEDNSSTKIEWITKKFYNDGVVSVSNSTDEPNKYGIGYLTEYDNGYFFIDKEEFYSFIKNARALVKNQKNSMRFDIGNNNQSTMLTSSQADCVLIYFPESSIGFYEFTSEQINNIEKAFNRYVTEKH